MTRQKVYYPELDALKGFAIFLVILGHAIIYFPLNLHENAVCQWLFQFVSAFHMPLFFCISGFLFSYRGNYYAYLWKKVKRIGIPYLVFNLLDMIPRSMLGFLFNRPRSITESIVSILFRGGEFWFLYVLFILYMIFPLLTTMEKRNVQWKIMIEGILFAWALLPMELNGVARNIGVYGFFFNTGFLFQDLYPAMRKQLQNIAPVRTIALSVVILIPWAGLISISTTPPPEYKYVSYVLLAFPGIVVSCLLALWKPFCDAFTRFGPWTLQLYLLNGWTLGVSRSVICTLLGVTNPVVIILFNMAVDFGLSYLFIKYVCARFRLTRCVMGIV